MRVESVGGEYLLIPDDGERIVATCVGLSQEGGGVAAKWSDNPHTSIRFLDRPYVAFQTDVIDHYLGPRRSDRNPRSWRLYADGELEQICG